jgi:5-methylcytosine-specific restriction endonuclease McrA
MGSPELASKLVAAGLWEAVEGGWSMPHYLERNPAAEVVRHRKAQTAKRNALMRDPALRTAIRLRDQDRCRYCGIGVRWSDRKGPQGATYDHVNPAGSNSYDNLVISCRACNSAKGSRTPERAGLRLRPAPVDSGATTDESRVKSRSNLGSTRPLPPPKGGKGARKRNAPSPHVFDNDGTGNCTLCPLPETNLEVHPDAA